MSSKISLGPVLHLTRGGTHYPQSLLSPNPRPFQLSSRPAVQLSTHPDAQDFPTISAYPFGTLPPASHPCCQLPVWTSFLLGSVTPLKYVLVVSVGALPQNGAA